MNVFAMGLKLKVVESYIGHNTQKNSVSYMYSYKDDGMHLSKMWKFFILSMTRSK